MCIIFYCLLSTLDQRTCSYRGGGTCTVHVHCSTCRSIWGQWFHEQGGIDLQAWRHAESGIHFPLSILDLDTGLVYIYLSSSIWLASNSAARARARLSRSRALNKQLSQGSF